MISRKVILSAIVIFFNILVLKICLGSFDVVSDIIKGFNYITGEFALGLYFASKTRAEYEEVRESKLNMAYRSQLPQLR